MCHFTSIGSLGQHWLEIQLNQACKYCGARAYQKLRILFKRENLASIAFGTSKPYLSFQHTSGCNGISFTCFQEAKHYPVQSNPLFGTSFTTLNVRPVNHQLAMYCSYSPRLLKLHLSIQQTLPPGSTWVSEHGYITISMFPPNRSWSWLTGCAASLSEGFAMVQDTICC